MEKPYGTNGEEQKLTLQKPIEISKFLPRIKPNKACWVHEQIIAKMDARLKLERSYAEAFM